MAKAGSVFGCPNCYGEGLPFDEAPCWKCGSRKVQRTSSGDQPVTPKPERRDEPPPGPFSRRAADALADEVAALVLRGVLDSRSPAADALLDYRTPPASPRADRLAVTDAAFVERDRELAEAATWLRDARGALEDCDRFPLLRGHIAKWLAAYDARRAPAPPAKD